MSEADRQAAERQATKLVSSSTMQLRSVMVQTWSCTGAGTQRSDHDDDSRKSGPPITLAALGKP